MKIFTKFILAAGSLAICLAGGAAAQGYGEWAGHRPVTIDNSGNPMSLDDYQVEVVLTAPDFDFGRTLPQGEDLRFSDEAGVTELSHWIETWDPVGGTATVWVRVPGIPGGGSRTILLHYDNPVAAAGSDGAATFLFYDGFENFNGSLMNAPEPLVVPTYDGSGQAVHPDVMCVPGGWNGYEYWLAMTPYPNSNNQVENPSVVASHDNQTWVVPAGLINPLAPTPAAPGHNDDTDMVLVGATLHLYWVETNADDNSYIKLVTSSNGVNWSAPQTVLVMPNYVMSPAVLYDAGTWRMWYATSPAGCTSGYQDIFLRTSTDGVTWGAPQPVDIVQAGRIVWHFDVQPVPAGYVMLLSSYPGGSTCAYTNLYRAESPDGLNWSVDEGAVLTPSPDGWDNLNVYRASFLVDGDDYRIWYSASSIAGQWRLGYVEGNLYDDFYAANQESWSMVQGNTTVTTDHPRTGLHGLRQVGGSTYPWLVKNLDGGGICLNAWLYDDMSTTFQNMAVLRAYDQGTPTFPIHTIGAGIWMGASTAYYSYHREGFQYTVSSVNRTPGWHKLSIEAGSAACDLMIDGQLVTTLSDLDEAHLTKMSLEGYRGGTSWFDDAYLRTFSTPEPVATVGSEMPTHTPQSTFYAPFRLAQNYPNPLNPGTVIRFELMRALPVRLEILDLQGRVVRILLVGQRAAGRYEVVWDGRDDGGRAAASGTYLYRLSGETHVQTQKLTLLR